MRICFFIPTTLVLCPHFLREDLFFKVYGVRCWQASSIALNNNINSINSNHNIYLKSIIQNNLIDYIYSILTGFNFQFIMEFRAIIGVCVTLTSNLSVYLSKIIEFVGNTETSQQFVSNNYSLFLNNKTIINFLIKGALK